MVKHVAWIAIALFAHSAHADSLESDATPLQPVWPRAAIDRPLTLAHGLGELSLDSMTATPDGSGAQPTTFSADVAYGVSDRFTLRAVHVVGFCTSDASSCMTTPRDVGLRGLYSAYRGDHTELALLGGIETVSGYPDWGVRLGTALHYRSGSIGILVEPSVRIGFTPESSSYPTSLTLPIALQYQTTRTAMLYLRSGISGYSEDGGVPATRYIGDQYFVPVAAGVSFSVDKHLDVAAELLYQDVAGPLGLGFTAPMFGVKLTLYL
ncbi:MAG: hypothetical protein ABI467_07330 [Kofleriaceae bacterium]